jgi:acyl carrier protein
METKILAFIVAVALVGALFVAYHVRLKRSVATLLASREPIPVEKFGTRYYSDPLRVEVAAFVAVKLQELTGYELVGILPNDSFDRDLHIDELDSLASIEIITEVESRFGVQVKDEEASGIHTIGEFVELVASKLESARGSQGSTLEAPR